MTLKSVNIEARVTWDPGAGVYRIGRPLSEGQAFRALWNAGDDKVPVALSTPPRGPGFPRPTLRPIPLPRRRRGRLLNADGRMALLIVAGWLAIGWLLLHPAVL